jgi:hypothetical protein
LGIYDSDSGSDISENEGAANGADSDQELRVSFQLQFYFVKVKNKTRLFIR